MLADTAWLVPGRCSDSKRQTLAPVCEEEGERDAIYMHSGGGCGEPC